MAYIKTAWANDSTPAISAENLDKMEEELVFLDRKSNSQSVLDSINTTIDICTIDNSYISSTGGIGSSNNYIRSDFIPVKSGMQIPFKLAGGSSIALIAYFSSDDISTFSNANSVIGNGNTRQEVYTVQADGYIIVSRSKGLSDAYVYFGSSFLIPNVINSHFAYVGSSGNRDDIKVKKNGTGLTFTIPNRLLVVGYKNTTYAMDFSSSLTINVPSGSFLVLNVTGIKDATNQDGAISVVTGAQIVTIKYEFIILAYANNGRCLGQWARYFYNYFNDRNIMTSSVWVGTSGNRNQIKIFTNGTGLIVDVPNRLLYYGNDGNNVGVYDTTATTYQLSHNDILYFDLDSPSLNVVSALSINTITNRYVVLAYANNGRCLGQWERYQIDAEYAAYSLPANNANLIICNRQGEIDDCPENSLIGTKTARQSGYDRVRVSVEITADGIPVCFHDANLGLGKVYYNGSVVTDTSLVIHNMNYSDLLNYDFGLYKGNAYSGTTISTLDEQAEQAKAMGYSLDVEIKENHVALTNAELKTIFDVIAKYGMIEQTFFRLYYVESGRYYISLNEKTNVSIISQISRVDIDAISALNTGKNTVYWAIYREELSSITEAISIEAHSKNVNLSSGSLTGKAFIPSCKYLNMIESSLRYPYKLFI